MTTLRSIPRRTPGFTARDVGEETIIISPKGDMLHTLDPVGTFIWRNTDGERSIADILATLVETYDVPEATAERDVLRFFEEMEQKNIVQLGLHPAQ